MVDGAPCGESKAGDVSLSVLWSSSTRAQRAYADRARRRHPPPSPRPHRVRARRPARRQSGPARRVAARATAPAVAVAAPAAPRVAGPPRAGGTRRGPRGLGARGGWGLDVAFTACDSKRIYGVDTMAHSRPRERVVLPRGEYHGYRSHGAPHSLHGAPSAGRRHRALSEQRRDRGDYCLLRPDEDSAGGILPSGTSLPLFSWKVTCASPPLGLLSGSRLRYSG
jgi:hypothetical protein